MSTLTQRSQVITLVSEAITAGAVNVKLVVAWEAKFKRIF